MPLQAAREPEPARFYDGGTAAEPPDAQRPAMVLLDRRLAGEVESFALVRRIGYRDDQLGDLLVPADLTTFRTDLTSVPAAFRWLVPRTGRHLPAALLHDGLVHPRGTPPTYVSEQGRVVGRVDADRVLRSAMRDLGTPVLRRWLVWSAVSLATITVGSAHWSRARHLRHLVAMVLSLLVVAGLGVLATLDLVDVVDVLPWMGDRSWPVELLGGFSGAVVVPFALGLTWGRPFRVAGVVASTALALLLHVTAAILVLTGAYRVAEAVAGLSPRLAALLAAAGVLAAAIVTVALVATALT